MFAQQQCECASKADVKGECEIFDFIPLQTRKKQKEQERKEIPSCVCYNEGKIPCRLEGVQWETSFHLECVDSIFL